MLVKEFWTGFPNMMATFFFFLIGHLKLRMYLQGLFGFLKLIQGIFHSNKKICMFIYY